VAATKGPAKTNLVVVGFALAGTLCSLMAIATSGVDAKWTGFGLFVCTLVFVVLGGRADLGMDEREYFSVQGTIQGEASEPISPVDDGVVGGRSSDNAPPPRHHLWLCLATISLALGGTLSIFPALVSKFEPVAEPDTAFVPVLFLFFNLGDMVGRAIAHPLTKLSPWVAFGLAVARTLQLPIFLLVKRQGSSETFDTFDDSGVRALVLFNGVVNGRPLHFVATHSRHGDLTLLKPAGTLYAAAAAMAPSTRPHDPANAGRLSALFSGIALAVGSVLGGAVVLAAD